MSIDEIRRYCHSFRTSVFTRVAACVQGPVRRAPGLEALENRQLLSFVPEWVTTIGTSQGGSSQFSFNSVEDVFVDNQDNVYATGTFRGTFDFDPGAGVKNLTATFQGGDGFVAKYKSNGELIWVRQFSGASSSEFASSSGRTIGVDDNGVVFVGGSFSGKLSPDFGNGIKSITSAGESDIYIAMIDPSGDLLSLTGLGGTGSDTIGQFVETGETLAFSGSSSSSVDLSLGAGANKLTGANSFLVAYNVDSAKSALSYQAHISLQTEGSGFSSISSVDAPAENRIFIQGSFQGKASLRDDKGNLLQTYDSAAGSTEAFIANVIISDEGVFSLNYSKTFSSTDFLSPGPVAVDDVGNVYLGLNIAGTVDINPGAGVQLVKAGSTFVPTLVSLDSVGNFRWGHAIGGTEGEVRDVVFNEANGSIVAVGYFKGAIQFDPAGSAGGKFAAAHASAFGWILEPSGKFIDAVAYFSAPGGNSNNKASGYADARSISVNDDGDVVVAGVFHGVVDFNPTTGVNKITSKSNLNSDDGFITNFGSNPVLGPADHGSTVPVASTDTFSQGKPLTITDASGNKVVLSLTGSGTGVITRTAGASGDIATLTVTGSTSKSNLSITVTGKANSGTTNIGSVIVGVAGDATADAIGQINAAKVNLSGGPLSVEGSAAGVAFGNVSNVSISIGGAPTSGTAVKLGNVVDTNLMVSGAISGIDVLDWDTTTDMPGHLTAVSVGKISSKADFIVSMNLSGASKGNTLGNVTVTGHVEIAEWNINGNTGSLTLGGMHNVAIDAGSVQGITVGKLLLDVVSIKAQSVGAFKVGSNVSSLSLTLNRVGPAGKPVSNLTSFSVAGTVDDLEVNTASHTNLGAFSFKGAAANVQIQGAPDGTIAGFTGTSLSKVSINTGSLTSFTASGQATDIVLIASNKIGAMSFKGDLSDATIEINGSPVKAQTSLTSLSVAGLARNIIVNSDNANNNLGTFAFKGELQEVSISTHFAATVGAITLTSGGSKLMVSGGTLGNITSSKSFEDLILTASNKVGALSFFSLDDGKIEITGTPGKSQSSMTSFTAASIVRDVTIMAAGANNNFGAITAKGDAQNLHISVHATASVGAVSLTGAVVNDFSVHTGILGAVTLSRTGGNSTGVSLNAANKIGAVNVKSSFSESSVSLTGAPSKAQTSLASLTVAGPASAVSITGLNANSNIGALAFAAINDVDFDVAGAIASFKSASANLLQIFKAGKVGSIAINGDLTGSFLALASAGATTVKGNVLDTAIELNSGGLASAASKALQSLTISGNANGLSLTGGGDVGNFGGITISGDLIGGLIRTQGSIASISVKSMTDSTILSGYDRFLAVPSTLATTSTGFVNTSAAIGSFTIKSSSGSDSFVNSKVMGVKIGTVTLKLVEVENGGIELGFTATKELGPVSRTDPANPKKVIKTGKITTPSQSIQTVDFALRIVS